MRLHRMFLRPVTREDGFSLIEAMLVLAVLAIAMTVALPRFRISEVRTISAFAADTAANLRTLRSRAINQNREMAVGFNTSERRFTFENTTGALPIPRNIDIILTSAKDQGRATASPRLAFFPDGSSTGGVIAVKSATQTMYIEVDWLTGAVSVRDVAK